MLRCYSEQFQSVILQRNSWSRLQISYSGFARLVSSLDAPLGFTDFVRGFGYKSNSTDEDFGGYHRHTLNHPSRQNIRYGESV